jgi:hypothetical protein
VQIELHNPATNRNINNGGETTASEYSHEETLANGVADFAIGERFLRDFV